MKSTRPSIGDWALSTQRRLTSVDRAGKYHDLRGWFILVTAVILLWLCKSFLKPVIMGAIFSVILYPLLMRWKKPRMPMSIRALLLTLGFLIVFLFPFSLLIFLGIDVAVEKIALVQSAFQAPPPGETVNPREVMEIFGFDNWLSRIQEIVPLSKAQIKGFLLKTVQASALFLSGLAQSLLADIPGLIISTFVILLTIYFLLMDGQRAVQFVRVNSIFSPRKTDELLKLGQNLCHSVLVATILAGVAQAGLVVGACLLAGIHFNSVALIGLISFMASFLPLIGNAPVTLGLILYGFAIGDTTVLVIFIITAFLVSVADNVVRPLVLNEGAKLHPLIAFVAAFAALDAIGFYGLFIGPVVAGIFFYSLSIVTRSTKART